MGFIFTGCSATVDLASLAQDREAKQFVTPDNDHSGIYIFRDSFLGKAVEKKVIVDSKLLGKTVNETYIYVIVPSGIHHIETESEFSNNTLEIYTLGGQNYFIRQYTKMGLLIFGANLVEEDENVGKKSIMKRRLIKTE